MNVTNSKKEPKTKAQVTWSSSIIDTFTNIPSKIDYYKTSCALNDCIKIYSTRVDELCANTNRMLKILEVKKKQKSQKETLESEEKLNLKEIPDFTDFFVRVKRLREIGEKQDFLLNSAVQIYGGEIQLFERFDQEPLFLENVEVDGYKTERFICPSLSRTKIEEDVIIDPNETINNIDIELENDPEIFIENAYRVDNFNSKPEFINPFLNDWSGRSKRRSTKKARKENKSKEPTIDWNIKHTDFKIGDTCLSHDEIRERRKNLNLLPDDYQYQILDLYKFSVRDGYISAYSHTDKENSNLEAPAFNDNVPEIQMNEINMNETNMNEINMTGINMNETHVDDIIDKFVGNYDHIIIQEKSEDDKKNVYRKIQKKVDISKLKDNILGVIEKGEKTFNGICKKIPDKYGPSEAKDISIQTCFISLLHLANEKNILLNSEKNNLNVEM